MAVKNLLTIDMITNEAVMILHQKLNMISNLTIGYDKSFGKKGAKIGDTLRIKLPMEYDVVDGPVIDTDNDQTDSLQRAVVLPVTSQKVVPMAFTSADYTMDINDFTGEHIEPAMSRLGAIVEADVASMMDGVSQTVDAGTEVEFRDILQGNVLLNDSLAPKRRSALLDSQANADLVDSLKGLFNNDKSISKQYIEGGMGRAAGLNFFENTLLPAHAGGASAGTSAYRTAGAAQVGTYSTPHLMSLNVDGSTLTVRKGQVFTLPGVFRVHPETKAAEQGLRQFVVLADFQGTGALQISPAIIPSGRYQNVTVAPADNANLTFMGSANQSYRRSVLFDKGFGCFATADLVLPPNEKASIKRFENISLRCIVDSYDPRQDLLITRLDVLYGYTILREQLAVNIWHQ